MNNRLTSDTNLALMNAAQAETTRAAKTLDSVKKSKEMAKIEGAAEDFESVFVAEMMKPMFEGISTDAPFGGGKGEEVFRGMLLQEYGKLMAQTGSIGLSTSIRDAMIQMQSAADHADAMATNEKATTTPDIIEGEIIHD